MIDEAWCIGCALCLKACPVDAIVGAAKRMHTVIDAALHRLRAVHPGLPGRLHLARGAVTGARSGWEAWSAAAGRAGARALRSRTAAVRAGRTDFRDARSNPTQPPRRAADPADRKRAIIEAAMARARAARRP